MTAAGSPIPPDRLPTSQCQLEVAILFVVMETRTDSISGPSPAGPDADEVRENDGPLSTPGGPFPSRKKLVQGRMKDGKLMVVNDQLKLESDTSVPPRTRAISLNLPCTILRKQKNGMTSAAATLGLGKPWLRLSTQSLPWPGEQAENGPPCCGLPPAFVDTYSEPESQPRQPSDGHRPGGPFNGAQHAQWLRFIGRRSPKRRAEPPLRRSRPNSAWLVPAK